MQFKSKSLSSLKLEGSKYIIVNGQKLHLTTADQKNRQTSPKKQKICFGFFFGRRKQPSYYIQNKTNIAFWKKLNNHEDS